MSERELRLNESELRSAPAWVRLAASVISQLPVGRYRAMNRLCRKPPPAFLMRLPEELGGYLFHCDLRDGISREVCFTGHYEPQVTALVRAILKPGMNFVDVGANWGYFTLLAANLVGPGGRVLGLEPDPRLFKILQENVRRSELDQVTVLPLAAADKAGVLTLAGYDEREENFGLSRIIAKSSDSQLTFQVSADTLDHVFAEHEMTAIDLLKMDIEGAEVFAFAGLIDSLAARRVKRLLLELHPRQLAEHGSHASAIIKQLHEAGYRAWTIDHSPAALRRAAYGGGESTNAWLHPFIAAAELDAWPHQLWLAPGIE
jgi:FkbM family methyltransferase